MRKKIIVALMCALLLTCRLGAQEEKRERKVLKNADVALMTQNQFDDETLIKIISVSETDFDTSGDALIEMKNKGVSSAVLRAMIQATQTKRLTAPEPASQSTGKPPIEPVDASAGASSGPSAPASAVSKSVSVEPAAVSQSAPSPEKIQQNPTPSDPIPTGATSAAGGGFASGQNMRGAA